MQIRLGEAIWLNRKSLYQQKKPQMKLKTETKVGILAVVSIAVLIIGYSFLKGNDVFSNEQVFYSKYSNVEGLSVSKPVLVNGFTIGRVSKMILLPNGLIEVELKIKNNYVIPENTVAKISSTDLLGNKAIVFDLGDSPVYALSGDSLQGEVSQNLLEQVEPVQKKAESMIMMIDSILTSVHQTITPEFQTNVNRSLASIANTLATLENTTKQVDGLIGIEKTKISNILGSVEAISANLEQNNERINHIFSNFESMSDQLAKSNFQETMEKTTAALSEFQGIMSRVNQGEGSLGKLVSDDSLYENLEDASKSLDELIKDMKKRPGRYVHFSVFGRKD